MKSSLHRATLSPDGGGGPGGLLPMSNVESHRRHAAVPCLGDEGTLIPRADRTHVKRNEIHREPM